MEIRGGGAALRFYGGPPEIPSLYPPGGLLQKEQDWSLLESGILSVSVISLPTIPDHNSIYGKAFNR